MLKDITNLSWGQTIGSILGFMGAISPGFLLIYVFKPELVYQLETVKLIIFSLSLSLPVFIINFLFISAVDVNNVEVPPQILAGFALFMSFLAMYPNLLMAYMFNLSFNIFMAILAMANFH